MTSADTLSINRLGTTIRLDSHWASLLLQLPLGAREQVACDSLNRRFPLVRFAELNRVIQPDVVVPNDASYLSSQASLHPIAQYPNGHINAESAWKSVTGKNTVKVGVVDTGIDYRHEDFNNGASGGPVVIGGWDWFGNQPQTSIIDYNGHGTKVAGIIGARRNNALGVAGIAGGDGSSATDVGVQLFDFKIFNNNGSTSDAAALASAIVEGAAYNPNSGYGYGLHAMNLSLGFPSNRLPINAELLPGALRSAFENNVTVVASKGNFGTNSPHYPADYRDDWAISVGASGYDGNYKNSTNGQPGNQNDDDYSANYGNNVDLIAPGTEALVYTTKSANQGLSSTKYAKFNGTSAAAAHATGVAALLMSQVNEPGNPFNNLAPEDVEQLLQRTATDRGQAGYDDYHGYGLLNAGKAVSASRTSAYKVAHAESRLATYTRVQQNTRVVLSGSYGTTAAGLYFADVYRGTSQITTADYVPSGYSLLDVWVRNSSSNLWSGANPVTPETDVAITRDQTFTYITGYTYYLRSDATGRAINQSMGTC